MSRITDKPDNLMFKWQSQTHRNNKKSARRPMTACQTCRATKVKCDGEHICGRCSTRGIACVYNKSHSPPATTKSIARKNSLNAQSARDSVTDPLEIISKPSQKCTPSFLLYWHNHQRH